MSSLVISTSPSISIVRMFKDFLNIIKTRFIGILLITLNTLRSNKSGTLEFLFSRLSSDNSSSSLQKLQFSKIKVLKFLNNVISQNVIPIYQNQSQEGYLQFCESRTMLSMEISSTWHRWRDWRLGPIISSSPASPELRNSPPQVSKCWTWSNTASWGELCWQPMKIRVEIYLEIIREILGIVFENHSFNVWTGFSNESHLLIWMEMYFLWGLKYLQLQFLLKCPSCFIDKCLIAECLTQWNSSLQLPQWVIGLYDGSQTLDTQTAVEDVQWSQLNYIKLGQFSYCASVKSRKEKKFKNKSI